MTDGGDTSDEMQEYINKVFSEEGKTPVVETMQMLAISQYEMVNEFVTAGFPRQEALYMVACAFSGNAGVAPDTEGT